MQLEIPDFKKEIERSKAFFSEIEKKQIPQATAWTLNDVSFRVREEEKAEANRVFDKPTRRTQNLVYIGKYDRATKRNLRVQIWVNDWQNQDKYLKAQIEGGPRELKRSERLLQRSYQMPKGMYFVPSRAMRKNKFGNISQGQMQQIISGLGAQSDMTNNSRGAKRRVYFVDNIDGTHAVWQRTKRGVKPVLIFVKSAVYKKRLDFYGVGKRVFATEFMSIFERQFERALRTAKKYEQNRAGNAGR